MNKNLKKVISAVIALALSVSSVAMAATGFTDVAETASYAQAVNTLAALDVIAGYEDGSFKPDDNITRAEVATMVVAALGRTADAEGAKGTTPFADVNTEAKAWATGFVNIGVEEGFISGYEDGSFKPDNNVTYAEIVSMLVRAAGYDKLAQYLGGWTTGYLSVGKDYGITTGVAAPADKAVTRAQVAQLLYNTLLNTPAVASSSFTTDIYGNLVPTMTIMNGESGRAFKTMLTEKHNAYYVEGMVTKTQKTDSATYKEGEVEFTVSYTKNYNDSEIVLEKGDTPVAIGEKILVGDTDAANYLNTYASAIIKVDEDSATIVNFIPSGKNDVVTFDSSLLDEETFDYSTNTGLNSVYGTNPLATATPVASAYVKYYASSQASKSTKYLLDQNFKLYVNGVDMGNEYQDFKKYVVENTTGEVEYTDKYVAGQGKDGKYDIISVTYYATVEVAAVNAASGKITFNGGYNRDTARYITLDAEDETLAFAIYYNGEEIEVSDLLEGDILSIVAEPGNLNGSKFYEIYVSRDTATGRVSGIDDEDEVITIGGTNYEFVGKFADEKLNYALTNEYTVSLDAFGRIYGSELAATSAKLAILDGYTFTTGDENYTATLVTLDGSVIKAEADIAKIGGTDATIAGWVYSNIADPRAVNKKPIKDRVVEYKISSQTGRIIALSLVAPVTAGTSYKESTQALGAVKMNDATVVFDAVEYASTAAKQVTDNLSVGTVASMFSSNGTYTAFAYNKNKTTGTYPLVIVTSTGSTYTYETNFAVIAKAPVLGYDDVAEEEIYNVEMFYAGEEDAAVNMVAYNDVVGISSLEKGDVVVFETDAEGKIEKVDVLATNDALNIAGNYTSFVSGAFAASSNAFVSSANTLGGNNWTSYWKLSAATPTPDFTKQVSQFVYGPIVGKTNSYFKLGSMVNVTSQEYKKAANAEAVYGDYIKDHTNSDAVIILDNTTTFLNADGTGAPASGEIGEYVTLNDSTTVRISTLDVYTSYTGLVTNVNNDIASGSLGDTLDVNFDDDTNVYVFDYSKTNAKLQLSKGLTSDIVANKVADTYLYNEGDVLPWTVNTKAGTNFAFAKVVDGTATDVFVIIAE